MADKLAVTLDIRYNI